MTTDELFKIHKHSFANRKEILKSDTCGCFYCKEMFAPSEIKEWVDDEGGDTAQCPYCMIDSVIGDASGIKITKKLLEEMYEYFFANKRR